LVKAKGPNRRGSQQQGACASTPRLLTTPGPAAQSGEAGGGIPERSCSAVPRYVGRRPTQSRARGGSPLRRWCRQRWRLASSRYHRRRSATRRHCRCRSGRFANLLCFESPLAPAESPPRALCAPRFVTTATKLGAAAAKTEARQVQYQVESGSLAPSEPCFFRHSAM
jgi:hypothetical protein